MVTIRLPTVSDASALNEIYDHYIRETAITFDLEPWTLAQREAWMAGFAESGRYRLCIAEEHGHVVGYACSRRFREKAAYETSVEVSVYLLHGAGRARVGSALYDALFAALGGEDIHRAIAGITLPNDASVALHTRFGFTPAGVMTGVGRKFGRYWDVAWFEKALSPG